MNNINQAEAQPMTHDKEIELHIKTTQGDWKHKFSKETTIGTVIQDVINHFHFATNGNYELETAKASKGDS